MQYQVVAPTVLVHAEPRRQSGAVHQLVYGDVVTVQTPATEREYVWVNTGWVHSAQVTDVVSPDSARRAWVIGESLVRTGTGERRLPFGARVLKDYVLQGTTPVLDHAQWQQMSVEGRLRTATAELLGSPYLPGGTTAWGTDCSGLVWAVWRFAGVEVPRLVAQLATAGQDVTGTTLRFGDVYIVAGRNGQPRHCALHVGPNAVVHSRMVTCGAVREPLEDLGGQVVSIRRFGQEGAA